MRRTFYILLAALMVFTVLISACAPAATQSPAAEEEVAEEVELEEQTLTLAGSTTVLPIAEKAAEAFMAENPNVIIEVSGGGSSTGVTSVGEGTVDIGNASRAIKDSEFEQFPDLQVFTIAYDGIAIVTNKDISLLNLDVEDVRAIFAGEITNYSKVGGPDAEIVVVSREEGSGTRGAFEEMVMAYKDDAGETVETPITETAQLQSSNGAVKTMVAETPNTIGFLSFGYLDDSINAVPVGGVQATVANAKNGSYPIVRPLNMLTNGAPNEVAQAFLDYILGAEGQALVVEEGYMEVGGEVEEAAGLEGTLTLAGSTTVLPIAEKASEAFMDANPDVVVEVQGGGSSTGVTSAGESTVDIGNASRAIKDSEFEKFPELQVFIIAYDGIAIVTNNEITLDSLTVEQVRGIFSGEITNFSEVGGPDAEIVVVSREEGSGTRGAFEEMVMAYKDDAGETVEPPITETAQLQSSNGALKTMVAETPNTIGFLSFGYLDDSVSAVSIDGVEATVENAKSGDYPIVRPLNMVTNGQPGELAAAFLTFIVSEDGQAIVKDEGYMTLK